MWDEKRRKIIELHLKKELQSKEMYNGSFHDVWKRLGTIGIFRLLTLKKYGGVAETYGDILWLSRLLGFLIPDSGLVFAINNNMIVTSGIICRWAKEDIKNQYFEGLLDGNLIASFAITESDTGSDAFNIKSTFHEEKDKIRVNGNKMYISNGTEADIFIVIVKEKSTIGDNNEMAAVLLEKKDEGLVSSKLIEKMGLENCPMAELQMRNILIPTMRMIGKKGMGQLICDIAFDWERCISFASHLGKMQWIMEECVKYVNKRIQFNKTIGSNQLVAEKIVQMKVSIDLGDLLLEKIANMKDYGKNTFLQSMIFKYFIGEKYTQCTLDSMQIFGAYGYCKESGIEQEVRNALAAKIYSGTSEIMINNIASFLGILL